MTPPADPMTLDLATRHQKLWPDLHGAQLAHKARQAARFEEAYSRPDAAELWDNVADYLEQAA